MTMTGDNIANILPTSIARKLENIAANSKRQKAGTKVVLLSIGVSNKPSTVNAPTNPQFNTTILMNGRMLWIRATPFKLSTNELEIFNSDESDETTHRMTINEMTPIPIAVIALGHCLVQSHKGTNTMVISRVMTNKAVVVKYVMNEPRIYDRNSTDKSMSAVVSVR
jgi:hypothetical protein